RSGAANDNVDRRGVRSDLCHQRRRRRVFVGPSGSLAGTRYAPLLTLPHHTYMTAALWAFLLNVSHSHRSPGSRATRSRQAAAGGRPAQEQSQDHAGYALCPPLPLPLKVVPKLLRLPPSIG